MSKPTLQQILDHLLIDYDYEVKDKDVATYDRAKQQLTQLIESIIGEDEHPEGIGSPSTYTTVADQRRAERNVHRTEQRQRAKDRGVDL